MSQKTNTRDDFPQNVVEVLKKRAAFICSNPNCRVMTVAPAKEDEDKVQYIGVAAHITAANEKGPRYNPELMPEERKSISNAIFLCNSCSTMIDKNKGVDYSSKELNEWKINHEKWILENLNKSIFSNKSITSSSNQSGGITAGILNISGISLNPIDSQKEHDLKIFEVSDKIFNEDDLNIILQSLLADESIWREEQDKLVKFKCFFDKSSSDYINNNIEDLKNNLILSLQNLLSFILNQFDMYPYNQPLENYKICMQPKLNTDRLGIGEPDERQAHTKLYIELRKVTEDFENKFKAYRKTVKTNLFI